MLVENPSTMLIRRSRVARHPSLEIELTSRETGLQGSSTCVASNLHECEQQ